MKTNYTFIPVGDEFIEGNSQRQYQWHTFRSLGNTQISRRPRYKTLGEELQPWALGLFSCNDRTVALAIPHELGLVLEVALYLQS